MMNKLTTLLLLIFSAPSWALSCGDWVFSDLVLDSDLLNCPAEGLIVAASNVTIDLNGFTIDGKGRGAGISVLSGHDKVTIVGPGTITDFGTGIAANEGRKHTIGELTIESVEQGVYWLEVADSVIYEVDMKPRFNGITLDSSSTNELLDNTIESAMGEGIWIRAGSDNRLSGNRLVSNHTAFAISGGDRNLFEHNSVFDNALGVLIAKGDAAVVGPANSNWIVGNKLYDNGQGVYITAYGDSTWMKYNRVERNAIFGGSSGLTLSTQNYRTEVFDNYFGAISGVDIDDSGSATQYRGNRCDGLICP